MNKSRLEAFSDGVLAILITIMVLELKMPHGTGWDAIRSILPSLGSYVFSFVFIGIYWGNHHHLLHVAKHVNGRIIWANMHLLFWLSLVPFATAWMAENNFDSITVAVYGGILVTCGLAYTLLANIIIESTKNEDELIRLFQRTRFKGILSTILYTCSIPLAFVSSWISCALFAAVSIMWFVPNKDVEKYFEESI